MAPSRDQRPAVWLWPNLLGLDAPLVALTWQAFVAACFFVPLRPEGRIALGLTVWSIYLADRLLDVRHPAQAPETERHRFHRRHRKFLTLLLAAALCADLVAVLLWLRPAVLRNGLLPLSGVLLYLGAAHSEGNARKMPKELAVALLFTAGTFLIGWTFSGSTQVLALPALSFLLLCLGNLVTIEMWEWRELRAPCGPVPHWLTSRLERSLRLWMPALAAIAFSWGGRWFLAIGLSATAITAIHLAGSRWSLALRRALIDAALLTPLPLLLK